MNSRLGSKSKQTTLRKSLGMGYLCHVHLSIIFMVWVLVLLMAGDMFASSSSRTPQVIAPHCPDRCGNVSIPYPFGLEDGCYYEDPHNNFKIFCDYNTTPPQPLFGTNFAVFNTSVLTGEICINRDISYECYDENKFNRNYTALVNIRGFTISSTNNLLIGMGCDTYVWFTGIRHGKPYLTGCMTSCNDLVEVPNDACNGVGCCVASLPDEVTNISTTIGSYSNHSNVLSFNPCSAAYPVAKNEYRYHKMNLTQDLNFYLKNNIRLPVVFNWAIGTEKCSVAQSNGTCLCKSNTLCEDSPNQAGYHCKCKDGFTGNPYLPQGCIGGDGSNNRIPIGDYYQTQQLGDDDDAYDDDDEDEADQGGKGKNKILKERWGHDEDIALVSGYLNCGGDPLVGTDQSKAKLWIEIKRIYDAEVVKKPSLIHPRTMKSIKAHWRTINRLVTLWVSQLGEAERMKASGMAITDVEAKAHELYKQKQNNKAFKLYHCWMGMRHLSRWQPGYDSTVVSQSSSKRSSDEVVSVRPDGQKKAKAQRKMKGVATSLDDFNNTLSEMQGERITIRKNIEEMMDYQKQRDEKKMRFKMYQLLMTKPSLDAVEFEYYEKLREEFMK